MGKKLSLFAAILFSSVAVFAQKSEYINGTEQIGNHNFENFDNLGSENVEPTHWNSFMTCNCSGLTCGAKAKQVDRSTEKRPGSTGNYSVRIWSRSVLGVKANGNLTTGKVNAGDTDPPSPLNYNFTERSNAAHSHKFSSIPDSVVVWVRFNPVNSSDEGGFEVILHSDVDLRVPSNQYDSYIVAYVKAIIKEQNAVWQRISVPLDKKSNTNVQYCLINATTNKNPGGGNANDELFIDDLLFVYNPTIEIEEVPLSIAMAGGLPSSFNVSYTLTGTMNPYNNLPDNKIMVELSDANGSFANPLVIGEVTSSASGTVACSIPYGIELGTGYRMRLRSTNYPMTSTDNGQNIEIYGAFMINAASANHRGTVSGNKGVQRLNAVVSLTARANQGNIFTHWSENGNVVENAGAVYSFAVDKDRDLLANFDTSSYQFTLTITTGGKVDSSGGNVSGSVSEEYIHNSVISLQAAANEGYEFSGYYENNVQIAAMADYSFQITKDRNVEARFTPRKFSINLNTNNALYGSVSGGGLQSFNSDIVLSAKANPYCEFIAWILDGDTLGKLPTLNYTVKRAVNISAVFAETRYPVVVNINPVGSGNVSGGGTYSAFNPSTTVTLTASAAAGYDFKRFVDDNTLQSFTQNPFVLLSGSRLTSAKNFTAYFELKKYNIVASVLPLAAGRVDGTGISAHGTNVSLNAVAAEGYEFVAWLSGSDTLSKSLSLSFVAGKDTAVNALFRLRKYDVSVVSNNIAYGNVSGSGVYEHFSTLVLNAIAADGYEFRSWTIGGNIIDTVSPFNYTVTSAVNIEANFSIVRKNVSVQVLPFSAGTVSGAGRYEDGAQVTLTAVENNGYRFVAWEDALGNLLASTPTLRFNALADSNLVARFEAIPYRITISSGLGGYGELSFDGVNYSSSDMDSVIPYGTTLPLYASVTATGLADKYKFTGWKNSLSEELLSLEDTFYYTVRKEERLLASFSNMAVSLSASAQPSYAGVVEGEGNYEIGSWFPLKAIANYGYRIKEWQTTSGLSLGTADSLMVSADKDTSFVVVFEKDSFNVSVLGAVSTLGVVSGAGRYCYKDTAVLRATVAANFHFVAWYEGGVVFSTDSVLKIEIDRAYNLTALFDSNEVSLTVLSSHPNNSIVSTSRLSKYGRMEVLTAVAGEGIHFIGWEYGNDTLSGDILEFRVLEDCTITALFDTNKYNLNIAVSAGGCVDVIAGSSEIPCVSNYSEDLYHNTPVKIITHANYGYHVEFDTLSFIIGKDTNVSVEFLENNITVLTSCNAEQGYTSVAGGNNQLYGHKVSIEAVAYPGYNFKKWTLASDTMVLFSTSRVISFTALRDTGLVAHFERLNFEIFVEVDNEQAGRISFGNSVVSGGSVEIDTVIGYNSAITLSAVSFYGYRFASWQINGVEVSTDNVYQVPSITEETSIFAVFEAEFFSVELSSQPSVCGEALGSGMYPYGSTVEIKGVAGNNFFFDRWISQGEFVSFDSVYFFVITRDTVLTAVFRTDTFDVNVDFATIGGSVSGGGRFLLGQEVSVAAEENYGYVFSEWQNNKGVSLSRENPFVFDASESISLYAVFVPQTFNVTINSNATGADIRGAGNYRYGDDACLLALSDNLYTFSHWEISEELTENSIFTAEELLNNVLFYPVEKDLEIRAVYQIKQYNVSATASPIMGGSVFNTGDYAHGSSFVLEAIAAEHYHFVHWVYKGVMLSENPQLPVDNLSSDMEFIATFEKDRHLIIVACTPSAGGVMNGGGNYNYGDTATLSVSLNPGYSLKNWRDKSYTEVLGYEASIKYIVKEDNYITATLTKDVSTEFVDGAEQVRIYPNPVSSLLYVDNAFVTATILDFTGKQILKANSSPIDVSPLKAGVYVLRITFSDGGIAMKKIVVN